MQLKSAAIFVLVSVIALASACSDDAPEPTPMSTPAPTPEPERAVYAPTLFEHTIAVTGVGNSWNPAINATLARQFGQVASMFIANECLAGRPMTPEAFVSYARAELGDQAQFGVEARRLMGEIVAVSDGPGGESCIRPFLEPRTVAEFELTSELVSAALGWTARVLEGEKRIEWYGLPAADRAPYLPWVCCENTAEGWRSVSSLFSIPLPVPADRTLPGGGTLLEDTGWDVQFQIDQLKLAVGTGAPQ